MSADDPTPATPDDLLAPVVAACRDAGEAIRAAAGSGADEKADGSPVTAADRAAHDVLVEALGAMEVRYPVVSEESAGHEEPPGPYWLVDPLDGTKEFLKGTGEYTVNVALVEDGTPRLGVVHVPESGDTYSGVPGRQAVLDAGRGDHPIRVAGEERPVRVAVSRSHPSEALDAFLDRLGDSLGDVETVMAGSSLKLCNVADGTVDLYPRLGPTMPWDIAAGMAVVRAAGGEVFGVDGTPLRLGTPERRNPWFVAVGGHPHLAARAWVEWVPASSS